MKMNHLATAILAFGILAAVLPVARADTNCSTNPPPPGSTVDGNLVVPPSTTCNLMNVTVGGNVQVETGAGLEVSGGKIGGNILADHCSFVALKNDASVGGNVQIQDCARGNGYTGSATSLIDIGGNFQCSGNLSCEAAFGKIGGNIDADGNTETFVNINSVGGNVQVNDNGDANVNGNTIGGNLQCQGNAFISGGGNTVHGQKRGQCAHF